MNRTERISAILQEKLHPKRLEIADNSGNHVGHAGARPEGETHYDLIIESAAFTGKSRVERHRMIHALLENEFKNGLHAMSIRALATGES